MYYSLSAAIFCLLTLFVLLKFFRSNIYRVLVVFLVPHAISLSFTLYPVNDYVTHQFNMSFSEQFDIYYMFLIYAVFIMGVIMMQFERHIINIRLGPDLERFSRKSISITFWLLLVIGSIGALVRGWDVLGLFLTGGGFDAGVLSYNFAREGNEGRSPLRGLISLPLYGSAMMIGPYAMKNRISTQSMIWLMSIILLFAMLKDMSTQQRGMTLNVFMLMAVSIALINVDKMRRVSRTLAVFSFSGLCLLFFTVIIFLRLGSDESSVLLFAIENIMTKFTGNWISASYIFHYFADASPLPGQITILAKAPFSLMVDLSRFTFFHLYPITYEGPWNSTAAIGGAMQDFGTIGGAVFFLFSLFFAFMVEWFFIVSRSLFANLLLAIILVGVALSIFGFQFIGNPVFMASLFLVYFVLMIANFGYGVRRSHRLAE